MDITHGLSELDKMDVCLSGYPRGIYYLGNNKGKFEKVITLNKTNRPLKTQISF